MEVLHVLVRELVYNDGSYVSIIIFPLFNVKISDTFYEYQGES